MAAKPSDSSGAVAPWNALTRLQKLYRIVAGVQLVGAAVLLLACAVMTVQFVTEAAQRETLLRDVRDDIQGLTLKELAAEGVLKNERVQLRVVFEGIRTLISSGSTHPSMVTRLLAHAKWCASRGRDLSARVTEPNACECYNGAHAGDRQFDETAASRDAGQSASAGVEARAPSVEGTPLAAVSVGVREPAPGCGDGMYWQSTGGRGGMPWEFVMNFSSASLMAIAILTSALTGAFVTALRARSVNLFFQIPLGLGSGLIVWLVLWSASGLITTGAGGTLNPYSCALLGVGAGLSSERLFKWMKAWFRLRLDSNENGKKGGAGAAPRT